MSCREEFQRGNSEGTNDHIQQGSVGAGVTVRSGGGEGGSSRNNKAYCMPAIQRRKKNYRMTVTHHLMTGAAFWLSLRLAISCSDYCMRALYCHIMLSVNTAVSNYTMYRPESTQHCLIAETDVIHSHFPQAVCLPRLSVCDKC